MKSIFQITLLSLVFFTGACSTKPTTPEDPLKDSTPTTPEDPPARIFQNALEQIGSTEGFTQWNREEKFSAEHSIKEQLFLSENSLKKINVQVYNGWYLNPITGKYFMYENEALTQYALEGDLVITVITNDFNLTEPDYSITDTPEIVRVNISKKMLAKGFTEIYQVTTTVENNWTSTKLSGSGLWEKSTPNTTEYYLVKRRARTLQMIAIYYDETLDEYGTYGVLDENVLNNILLSYTL